MSDFLCMYCGLILKNRLEGQMHEDGHRSQIKKKRAKIKPLLVQQSEVFTNDKYFEVY